ncbi:MAG: hypothetical protein ABI910_08355 [Gemmatimonadota bacterium]
MPRSDTSRALAHLFSELALGAPGGGDAFILNSGDVGFLKSLDKLSLAEASHAIDGGATIAAHARHVTHGLELMNRWATDGGNPFADARWDEAWKTSAVTDAQWQEIRASLRREIEHWIAVLGTPRDTSAMELTGMIASVAHLAYHLGAIRQIATAARGPRDGAFTHG